MSIMRKSGRERWRGFASLPQEKQREIASQGGIAAHDQGVGHEWTIEEARKAGRKGGLASHRNRRRRKIAAAEAVNGFPTTDAGG